MRYQGGPVGRNAAQKKVVKMVIAAASRRATRARGGNIGDENIGEVAIISSVEEDAIAGYIRQSR